ncbi:unnamed protein product [Cuscuta epithymum]|uniref:Uncharacterized protein n=1 Tax=Cuscuta epithymum TaxID=186058 RepID=A0AAV0F1P5_9ASTE|nr:unnamed protein product [Cuscuta epithymum]
MTIVIKTYGPSKKEHISISPSYHLFRIICFLSSGDIKHRSGIIVPANGICFASSSRKGSSEDLPWHHRRPSPSVSISLPTPILFSFFNFFPIVGSPSKGHLPNRWGEETIFRSRSGMAAMVMLGRW